MSVGLHKTECSPKIGPNRKQSLGQIDREAKIHNLQTLRVNELGTLESQRE